ncbi:MAG: hypothetical protein ACRC6V_09475 [Bacteroidales bacterium]
MKKQYYYITVDAQDGSAFTVWFEDKATWLLWNELNEASPNPNYEMDDGFLLVDGTIDAIHIMTEAMVRERFSEEDF